MLQNISAVTRKFLGFHDTLLAIADDMSIGALTSTTASTDPAADVAAPANSSAQDGAFQASPSQLMQWWDYNHRISTTIDSLMMGPLVVAVWAGFAVHNIMPMVAYNRLRWVLAKRGEPIGRCAKVLVGLTCCCGTHDGPDDLSECLPVGSTFSVTTVPSESGGPTKVGFSLFFCDFQ